MICPRCGRENKGRNVCYHCGQFLQDGNKLNKRKLLSPEERKKLLFKNTFAFIKNFAISAIVLFLSFIILSIIFIYGYRFLINVLNLDDYPTNEEIESIQKEEITEASLAPAPSLK